MNKNGVGKEEQPKTNRDDVVWGDHGLNLMRYKNKNKKRKRKSEYKIFNRGLHLLGIDEQQQQRTKE